MKLERVFSISTLLICLILLLVGYEQNTLEDTIADSTADLITESNTKNIPISINLDANSKTSFDHFLPTGNKEPRLSIETKFGVFELRPKIEDMRLTSGDTKYFRGNYEWTYHHKNEGSEVVDLLEEIEIIIDQTSRKNTGILDFVTFELLYFIPAPDWYQTNIYAYVIENTGQVYPVSWVYAVDEIPQKSPFFNIDHDHQDPFITADQKLSVYVNYGNDTFYELVFSPELNNKVLRLQEATDRSQVINDTQKTGQILVDAISREWKNIDEAEIRNYRELFTDSAWNHKGFQYMYQNSQISKGLLRLEFAVAVPRNIRIISPQVIQFTISFNLLDIFNQMAYVDVEIRKKGDRWIIEKIDKVEIKEIRNKESHKIYNIHVGLEPGIYR